MTTTILAVRITKFRLIAQTNFLKTHNAKLRTTPRPPKIGDYIVVMNIREDDLFSGSIGAVRMSAYYVMTAEEFAERFNAKLRPGRSSSGPTYDITQK